MTQLADVLVSVLSKYQQHPSWEGLALSSANQKGRFEDSLLHVAARSGNHSDVLILIEHGADINASGDMSYTPLHSAVRGGHAPIVSLLMDCGADLSKVSEFGRTAAEDADLLGYGEIAKTLRSCV